MRWWSNRYCRSELQRIFSVFARMGELRPLIEGLLKRFVWADRARSPDSGQWLQALELSSLAGIFRIYFWFFCCGAGIKKPQPKGCGLVNKLPGRDSNLRPID
jgi:hypothetical protein